MNHHHLDILMVSWLVDSHLKTTYPRAGTTMREEARLAALRVTQLGAGLDGALDCARRVMETRH